ncbi:Arv1-domain-containing protein [Decorospora gaudefroyi]|uniref:Protein ARV n=1 Tax=Decorospora gaudefroyi TaxID=184978 RepID=A0A6A5K2S5_9PLEO|nr:Arv1-domain-containing protein [Decorospora gaudefroyi]
MPICISCRTPVRTLYTTYSKADDRSLGKGVRLTQCPVCKKFADKYVEHDFVVLFIDLVLIKPEVYRHLLFNRLEGDGGKEKGLDRESNDQLKQKNKNQRSILRLGILLLLFDVYLTWARIEKLPLPPTSPFHPSSSRTPSPPLLTPHTNAKALQSQPLGTQYLFFLALVSLCTLAFHLPIRLLCSLDIAPATRPTPASPSPLTRTLWRHAIPYFPHPTRISTALLVSSCTKLFPILLIVWDYDLPSSATAVSWAVIVNNVAALEILMDCGYVRAGTLVGVAAACRGMLGWALLRAAGLGTGWEGWTVAGAVGELVGTVAIPICPPFELSKTTHPPFAAALSFKNTLAVRSISATKKKPASASKIPSNASVRHSVPVADRFVWAR